MQTAIPPKQKKSKRSRNVSANRNYINMEVTSKEDDNFVSDEDFIEVDATIHNDEEVVIRRSTRKKFKTDVFKPAAWK